MESSCGAIPNFATEKEQKRNFLDFNDVTLVVVDIKSERFVKSTCLQQDLFDMTRVTMMFDTKILIFSYLKDLGGGQSGQIWVGGQSGDIFRGGVRGVGGG